MKIPARMMLAGLGMTAWAVGARVEPGLPVWDDVELADLEAGGWVAGSLLLTDEPVPEEAEKPTDDPLEVARPTAEEIPANEVPPDEIPEEFWPAYFGERPKSFLIDPQGLLSPVDFRDRVGFLDYHSSDSSIDLYVYVFKGDQDIPGEVREEEVVERFYSEGRPAAVVYYFMGAPQRSVFYLSPDLTDVVSASEQRRALDSSVMQAFEKVDPARQIEAFLVQMSIRIYWMERMTGGGEANDVAFPEMRSTPEPVERDSVALEKLRALLESAKRYAALAVVVFGSLLTGLGMSYWMKRRVRYRFPEFDVEPRLGGAHAAGVGAVISFASATLPPASQRDQVPDYLRRM